MNLASPHRRRDALLEGQEHTLKSSSANVGAVRLAETCQDIEDAISRKDVKVLADLLGTVGGEYFAAEEALKEVLYLIKKNGRP